MQPIIKWAGGKRQLLKELKSRMPENYNNYFEPFFGAGALFLDLELDKKCYINDFNHSLVNLYYSVKEHNDELVEILAELECGFNNAEDKKEYYYNKRERYNEILNKDSYEEAALLIFLNKTDYNGLYRVNLQGKFNVPFGQKTSVNLMCDKVKEMKEAFHSTTITEGDFEKAVLKAEKGDFVYFDPPYDETFVDYQLAGFNKDDQKRLFELFDKLTKKGVYCMLSNSATDFILDLYKEYKIEKIPVKRFINRKSDGRNDFEVIITNYDKL